MYAYVYTLYNHNIVVCARRLAVCVITLVCSTHNSMQPHVITLVCSTHNSMQPHVITLVCSTHNSMQPHVILTLTEITIIND